MHSARLAAMLVLVAAPLTLAAQQPTTAPARDSTTPKATVAPPHALPLTTANVSPGVRQYDVRLQRADSVIALGTRVVTTDTVTYAGRAAWRVVANGGRGVLLSADTSIISRDSLRVLHWASVLGLSRLSIEIPGDTLFGGVSTPLGRRSLVLGLPRDAVVGKESFDLVLAALPLALGWRDSVHVLQLDASATEIDSVTLSVDGEEKVVTPAGEFDTWVVHLFAPVEPTPAPVVAAGAPDSTRAARDSALAPKADSTAASAPSAPPAPVATLWVDRRTGVVVREEQPIERLHGRLVRELVLSR